MNHSPRSRVSQGSLLAEVAAGVTGRPVRSALTALGIAIGLAAFVATIGISQSAGAQIVIRFHDAQATFLTASGTGDVPFEAGDDAVQRVRNLAGVTAAAEVTVHGGANIVRTRAQAGTPAAEVRSVLVLGGDPAMFTTTEAVFSDGRPFDDGHVVRHARVTVVGIGMARRIGLTTVVGQPIVVVDGKPLLVIGILEDASFFADALDSLIIPHTTATDLFGAATNSIVLVATVTGSTFSVAADLPYVLRPQGQEEIDVAIPPPPPNVASAIGRDLDSLALTLAGVGAVVAAISVAAIMTINVVERVPEIGLRRAFGASRSSIAIQFLLESTAIGLVGGIFGAVLGLTLVVGAAQLREWTPVMTAIVPYLSVALGTLIGLISGTYPAIRAARVSPTTSLRA